MTNIETAETEYLEVDGSDPEWKAMIATCALPIMFQPVEIDGKLYMDGGITEYENGAEFSINSAPLLAFRSLLLP